MPEIRKKKKPATEIPSTANHRIMCITAPALPLLGRQSSGTHFVTVSVHATLPLGRFSSCLWIAPWADSAQRSRCMQGRSQKWSTSTECKWLNKACRSSPKPGVPKFVRISPLILSGRPGRRVVGSDKTERQASDLRDRDASLIPPSDCLHEYLQLEMGPIHFSFVFLPSAYCAAAISSCGGL